MCPQTKVCKNDHSVLMTVLWLWRCNTKFFKLKCTEQRGWAPMAVACATWENGWRKMCGSHVKGVGSASFTVLVGAKLKWPARGLQAEETGLQRMHEETLIIFVSFARNWIITSWIDRCLSNSVHWDTGWSLWWLWNIERARLSPPWEAYQ